MKLRRVLAAMATIAALIPLTTTSALAAPPTNDSFGGATPASLGFSQTLDTTEATTDADDAEANATCGAPAIEASVWYSYSPPADGAVVVDVSASSFAAGLIVVTGSPGSLALVTCGPGAVAFGALAGETYSVLAFDFVSGAGNGGSLRIEFAEVAPPPTIEVTIDPVGGFDSTTGSALLSGTLACTNATFVAVLGEVRQDVGRFRIQGFFDLFASGGGCDGTPHPWSAQTQGENGKFKGGKAVSVAFSFACGPFQCSSGFTEQRVQLKGGRG